MTNSTTKTVLFLAKYWLMEIFAVFALSLLMPVQVLAENSENNCSYTGFDHLAVLYYRQAKVKELKITVNELGAAKPASVEAGEAIAGSPDLISALEDGNVKEPNFTHDKVAANYPEGEKPDKVVKAVITAYTSTPDQTDSTPDIAASGKHVYDGMIAANWLPFGTKIKIPALYGDKIFTVDDRMNKRYGYGRLDVWLDVSKAEARKFGVQRVEVLVFMEDKPVTELSLAK